MFEASGADLMAGQQWFGQLEGRIQRTVEELAASKKLIWYIPDILQIALSGTHQGQAASILDQILPAISAGRLIVWTEASAAGTARLFACGPRCAALSRSPASSPWSRRRRASWPATVARASPRRPESKIDPACVDVALASARQYLTRVEPSRRRARPLEAQRRARAPRAAAATSQPDDIIETLAQLTGLPASILDSNERVDLAAVRGYFAARVIGQDEAVDAIVERIAMLKAGLNDPGKPIGVFLFAGPTGTGKTELAKTLAEFLFGSQERMIRLDMSEFQTPEFDGEDPRQRRGRRARPIR